MLFNNSCKLLKTLSNNQIKQYSSIGGGHIFKSPWKSIDIPSDKTLSRLILERVDQFGNEDVNRKALTCAHSNEVVTFSELSRRIRCVAHGFQSDLGLKQGESVCIFSPNTVDYPSVFHGALLAGGVVSPVSPQFRVQELVVQIQEAHAKWVVTVSALSEIAVEAASICGLPASHVIIMDPVSGKHADQVVSLRKWIAADNQPDHLPTLEREIDLHNDAHVLPFSSGTTGKPKGVMLTSQNLVTNLLQVDAVESESMSASGRNDVYIGVLPYFHIFALLVCLNYALFRGVHSPVMSAFDLPLFLETLQKHKVTVAHIVPPIVVALAKHPIVDKYDLSSLKVLFSGAAPLSADVENACAKRLGCTIKQAWGMSELSPAGALTPTNRIKQGSSGPLVPNTIAKIVGIPNANNVDANFIPEYGLGPNEIGEIYIKGPQVMKGYYHREDATKESFSSEGFLKTGDTGYIDDDGYVFITDRTKDLIKYKGHQISGPELEAILLTHDKIADAAVVPSPDEMAGDLPKAFVQLQQGQTMSEQEVIDFVADQVAPFKKVRLVEFIDLIPKSPAGKILRRVLVQQERERVLNNK
mmetsp:Transcript_20180/g.30007  ORF Transcript_20180/g.30007 Transcript_20180/m.30007 type:complete len:585 (-) Transcript_20180:27-1781(-)